jgi:phage FluMu protein Com
MLPIKQCDLRCHCGNLLARLVPEGVELKCRRCKRTVVLPLETDVASPRTTTPS